MKYVYLIDRNILSIIKDSNSGKLQHCRRKLKVLKNLRNIDKKNCTVTALFSNFEGEKGYFENLEEADNTINKETEHLNTFFRNANVDFSICNQLRCLYLQAKLSREYKFWIQTLVSFLEDINDYIVQCVSDSKFSDCAEKICIKAKEYNIQLKHPVVLLSLLCLSGDKDARKLLKPKKDKEKVNYYNAVMDILHCSNLIHINSKLKGKAIVKFISDDSALNNYIKFFDMKNSNSKTMSYGLEITVEPKLDNNPKLGQIFDFINSVKE